MIVVKRRLIFWLFKAYFKKWGKVIFVYFLLGLFAFFILLFSFKYFASWIIFTKREIIGVTGTYTIDTLPDFILYDISHGLTSVGNDGIAKPDLASSWKIEDNGKTYIFTLRPSVYFTNGVRLTSREVNFSFSGVSVRKPDNHTIVYNLKDAYAPFLITAAHPVFENGFMGAGDYVVTSINLNSNFVESITIRSRKEPVITKTYQFYPTQEAVKIAFAVGEISKAWEIDSLAFQRTSFQSFPNVSIQKNTDYSQLVTLFYNTKDGNLSDKRLRESLAYALPNTFPNGERAHSPLSPRSFAYQEDSLHAQDFDHARLLLEASGVSKTSLKNLVFVIDTLSKYHSSAQLIADAWQKIGIKTKIVVVSAIPSSFQLYLGDFQVPKDPDQYTLWHSYQTNNITNYKNLRIDKLLEDGRVTIDQEKRVKIYADFQKYLLDDSPASFLYFPYVYTVTRK